MTLAVSWEACELLTIACKAKGRFIITPDVAIP